MKIPLSVGDKVYRTTEKCEIQEGEVIKIKISSIYHKESPKGLVTNTLEKRFVVSYEGYDGIKYDVEDLGKKVFLSEKSLIRHLMSLYHS